jgi:hypothetical protein
MKSSRVSRLLPFSPKTRRPQPNPIIIQHIQALQVVLLNRPKMAKAILDLTESQAHCSLQTDAPHRAMSGGPRCRD